MRIPAIAPLAVAMACSAWGIVRGDEDQGVFDRLDANRDGLVSSEEVGEQHQRLFKRLLRTSDTNDDGKLSREEFAAGTTPQAAPQGGPPQPGAGNPQQRGLVLLRQLDKDQDGQLSAEEIANAPQVLAKLDQDNDGALSIRELAASARQAGAAMEAMPELQRLASKLWQADANRDQKISRDEAPPRLLEQFDRVDANADGQLDRQEVGNEMRRMVEILRSGGEPARKLRERLQGDRPSPRPQP